MAKSSRAAEFLKNMSPDLAGAAVSTATPPVEQSRGGRSSRTGLKHIGGYLDAATVEKVAILRARLNLDNSELLKLAIDGLHARQMAKRAFGDA
jgi:hypothetical protein